MVRSGRETNNFSRRDFLKTVIGGAAAFSLSSKGFGQQASAPIAATRISENLVLVTGAGPIGIMAAAVVRHAGSRVRWYSQSSNCAVDRISAAGLARPLSAISGAVP